MKYTCTVCGKEHESYPEDRILVRGQATIFPEGVIHFQNGLVCNSPVLEPDTRNMIQCISTWYKMKVQK